MLVPSELDHTALAGAVEERFLRLCKLYLKMNGMELPIPKSLDADFYRWRQMRVRHKQGDFRHTEAEWRSVKTIAQWTLDINCELRGQPKQELDCLKE